MCSEVECTIFSIKEIYLGIPKTHHVSLLYFILSTSRVRGGVRDRRLEKLFNKVMSLLCVHVL